jgi:hypothetical protein
MDNSVPRIQLKRVNPFMGLMIDAQTWLDSHDYHRYAEQAHSLALHGWGIVSGLEVDATDPTDRAVWIRPGVAIDPEGKADYRRAALPLPDRHPRERSSLPGLLFREIPSDPMLSIEDGSERPSRLLEAYAIYERDRLPDQPHIELARFTLTDNKQPLKDAADPVNPKPNEIDKRYREQAAIRPGLRTTVGVWKPGDIADTLGHHAAGPTRLLSALSSSLDWRLRRRDQPETADNPLSADLLLMPVTAQSSLSDSEKKQLGAFLDGGGVLLVEACASKAGGDAAKAMASVAQAVKRQPKPVGRDHPLLTSRHIFSAPPPGAATGQLLEGDGLVVSTADYACAWNGGLPDKPLDRAVIRATVEFAENMLSYAQVRRGNATRAQRSERKGK